MVSASPTILALETDSAWVVVLAVSAVTLIAALILRRLIGRPGGLVAEVASHVRLKKRAADYGLGRGDDRVRPWIERIPGANR